MAIAFVAIAMVLGGIVSVYETNQGTVEAKDALQVASVETVQIENAKMTEAEIMGAAQAEKSDVFMRGVRLHTDWRA